MVNGEQRAAAGLVNPTVNVRIVLALFWVGHFMLWTFGDILSLLQEMDEPTDDSLILIVAPTTAIVQALMIVLCLVGRPAYVRLANLIVTPIYVLLNIGFFVDATEVWEYYLGVFYVLFNGLIIWRAYAWPKSE